MLNIAVLSLSKLSIVSKKTMQASCVALGVLRSPGACPSHDLDNAHYAREPC